MHEEEHFPAAGTQPDGVPPIPQPEDFAASRAFASTFERLLDRNDELLRLRKRARQLLAETAPASFEGLSHLVDELLPRERERIRKIADALRLSQSVLVKLRGSSLDPLSLSPASLTSLGRIIDLDFATFSTLLERDHARFSAPDQVAFARTIGTWKNASGGTSDVLEAIRSAWERAERDDAAPG
jgi:hypothetical protein